MSEATLCNTGRPDLSRCTNPAEVEIRHLTSGREYRRCEDCASAYTGLDTYEVVADV